MAAEPSTPDPLRFHAPHVHLTPAFGGDWFGIRAERFARFFGTPGFLATQTLVVGLWVVVNSTGLTHFDIYPFIFLNLAFSLQSAYAAPLILLAQTRQADRDKANGEADAQHREGLAQTARQQQAQVFEQNERLLELLQQNTRLAQATRELSERIESLTHQIHQKVDALPMPPK